MRQIDSSPFIHLTINLLVYDSEGDATQVLVLGCNLREVNNTINHFHAMEDIRTKMQTSRSGTTVTITNPDGTYGLAQCFGDRSTSECLLYYAVARATLSICFSSNGSRVLLNGFFMRFEAYNFFGEQGGPGHAFECANSTMRDNAFEKSARKVVLQAVKTAPKSKNYHARTHAVISATANNYVYAVADCWSTLDPASCRTCLQTAGNSMLDCLPSSSGLAINTGCFMRYYNSSSSYPDNKRPSKGK